MTSPMEMTSQQARVHVKGRVRNPTGPRRAQANGVQAYAVTLALFYAGWS